MNTLWATLVVGVLAGLAGIARAGQAQAPAPGAIREPDLTRWFEAVEQHRPGFNDPALETIKSLSPQVFSQIRRALGDRRRGLSVELFNRLVHRGAAMHMDAAMVLVDDDGRSGPLRRTPSSRVGATAVLSADGGFNGLDVTGPHWEYGRALVDLTLPLPSEDGTAKLWYVAAAAFMANRSLLAELSPHLEKARKLFPADPDILFVSGCYFEAMASPRLRPLIDSNDLPHGVRIAAPSARESWRQAEYYFRRATEGRPDFAAARVRRARSLHILGRHDEALSELRGSISLTTDPALLYYAAIFEGAAHEALGDMTAARESYERAATGFPNAQSPLVALSRIARDRGDRGGAQAAMARVFARETRAELEDPWWTYHLWFVPLVRAQRRRAQPAAQAIARAWWCQSRRSQEMTRAIASVLLTVLVLGEPSIAAQTFRSHTQGVRVDVLVSDRGKPVGGLTVDDFELFDNGIRQTITLADFDQLPLNVVLAFDMSRSVTRDRLGNLQRAAGTLLDALTKQDQAGLITFSHAVALRHNLTKDLPRLRHALARLEPAGTTALIDGIYAGMMLGESGVGRALLIVFSDGVDTASWLTPDSVLQTAKRSDVVAYGVSVGRQKPEFLRGLGEATGGQVFENESADNLEQRFLAVLDEFRRRYVLMYTPTSSDPGWHRLEVRVKGRRGTVHARPGYLADTPGATAK